MPANIAQPRTAVPHKTKKSGGARSDPADLSLLRHLLQRADVLHDRLAPSIDVVPRAVTHAVLEAGHVDHVPAALRRRHLVVRLLIGDHNEAVILFAAVKFSDRAAKIGATVRLAVIDGVAQREAATRRDLG